MKKVVYLSLLTATLCLVSSDAYSVSKRAVLAAQRQASRLNHIEQVRGLTQEQQQLKRETEQLIQKAQERGMLPMVQPREFEQLPVSEQQNIGEEESLGKSEAGLVRQLQEQREAAGRRLEQLREYGLNAIEGLSSETQKLVNELGAEKLFGGEGEKLYNSLLPNEKEALLKALKAIAEGEDVPQWLDVGHTWVLLVDDGTTRETVTPPATPLPPFEREDEEEAEKENDDASVSSDSSSDPESEEEDVTHVLDGSAMMVVPGNGEGSSAEPTSPSVPDGVPLTLKDTSTPEAFLNESQMSSVLLHSARFHGNPLDLHTETSDEDMNLGDLFFVSEDVLAAAAGVEKEINPGASMRALTGAAKRNKVNNLKVAIDKLWKEYKNEEQNNEVLEGLWNDAYEAINQHLLKGKEQTFERISKEKTEENRIKLLEDYIKGSLTKDSVTDKGKVLRFGVMLANHMGGMSKKLFYAWFKHIEATQTTPPAAK